LAWNREKAAAGDGKGKRKRLRGIGTWKINFKVGGGGFGTVKD